MIILFKYVSFFLLASCILFSCSRKGTQPEPPPKKPATLIGKVHCLNQPTPDVEVLVLSYKPDYDTLGADTTEADSGFFYIDDLPNDTANVIFNDVVFTGPHEDYFTFKVKLILEKGTNEYKMGLRDTSYLDEIGRPNYLLQYVCAAFDSSIDSATADFIVKLYGGEIIEYTTLVTFNYALVLLVSGNHNVYQTVRDLNFDFYVMFADPAWLEHIDWWKISIPKSIKQEIKTVV